MALLCALVGESGEGMCCSLFYAHFFILFFWGVVGMSDRLSPSPLQQQAREQAAMSSAAASLSEIMSQGKPRIVARLLCF